MSEQVGWRGLIRSFKAEAPRYAALLPQIPRLLHQRLNENPMEKYEPLLLELAAQQRQRNFWLKVIGWSAAISAIWFVLNY